MQFEALNKTHAQPLLDFEVQNRAFFEAVIAPREEDFYSPLGIQAHIASFLYETDAAAYVLLADSIIVARANIRNITSNGVAEIGYRVGENAAGRGIGSFCVSHLMRQAILLNMTQLVAYVMHNNPASMKVLVKNGFELTLCLPNKYKHQGRLLHGFKFHRDLANKRPKNFGLEPYGPCESNKQGVLGRGII